MIVYLTLEKAKSDTNFSLQTMRKDNLNKLIFPHLNINSIRNTLDSLADIIKDNIDILMQGRSEGTSSVAFKVLIINCQIYFINSFILHCLTLNTKLFIFKFFDVKFLFSENHVFVNRRERLFMELWTRVLSFGF